MTAVGGWDSLETLAESDLTQARSDLDELESAVYERCLPLTGMTRAEASERISAVIGTRPAATDDLRQVAALFGLTVTTTHQPPAAA